MENLSIKNPRNGGHLVKDSYELAAWGQGLVVCGVDEVGRGCLAGPMVTAAVILHPNKRHRLLKDSKILTQDERQKGAAWIVKNSWYSFGIVSSTDIDTYNIYQATLIAMKRAVTQVMTIATRRPSSVLVDAMPLKLSGTMYQDISIYHFPKGESKSSSIAAASIIAKVKRDALISRFDGVFPGYKLSRHKGYATAVHCDAVREHGRSIIHRTTFLRKVFEFERGDNGEQTVIF
jgi:ribonuclease HII